MEENRCDNEMEVFNAKVHEDEIVINIQEYEEMKNKIESFEKAKKEYQAHVTYLEKIVNEKLNDNSNILNELKVVNEENRRLKRGLINFIKGLSG